jgi:SH3 domain protein
MKSFFWIFLSVVLAAAIASAAETHYVNTEVVEITFRTGPGMNRKIITMLQSNQTVTLIQSGEEWSKVRLPDGRDGWVLSRYLTTDPPSQTRLIRLQNKHQTLTEKMDQVSEENITLKSANEELSATLAQTRMDLEALNSQYETLKSESAEFLEIKEKYTQVSDEFAKHESKSAKIQKELDSLKMNQSIKWFLAGGGMILLGIVIGFSARRKKRRSSLY